MLRIAFAQVNLIKSNTLQGQKLQGFHQFRRGFDPDHPAAGEKRVVKRIRPGQGPGVWLTFLIVPRFNMATLITMIEPLRIANYLAPHPLYHWDILSMDGTESTASNGLTITAQPVADRNRRGEMLFVLASWGVEDYQTRELFSWIRRQAREGVRIASVELGCHQVARAGLLSGAKLATHWSWAPGFQERSPDIALIEQIYTLDDQRLQVPPGRKDLVPCFGQDRAPQVRAIAQQGEGGTHLLAHRPVDGVDLGL